MLSRDDDAPAWAPALGVAILAVLLICLAMAIYPGWSVIGEWSKKADAPAWVQAIGSILAIIFSGLLVWVQHRLEQRRSWQTVLEERLRRVGVVVELARATSHATKAFCKMFENFSDLFEIASGDRYFDQKLLATFDHPLESIPLYELDDATVVIEVVLIKENARQFKENLQKMLRLYRNMNAEDFTHATKVLHDISDGCHASYVGLKVYKETLLKGASKY